MTLHLEITHLKTWEDAIVELNRPTWENTTLKARNVLTSFLHQRYRNEYGMWSKVAKEGKLFIQENVVPKILFYKELYPNNDVFLDCVKWDILGAIMEHTYRKFESRPTFFTYLLSVYENGNFPCGWAGEWPKGKLIVY